MQVCCRRREGSILARKEKTPGEFTCMQIYELYEGKFKSPKSVEGRLQTSRRNEGLEGIYQGVNNR